MIIAPSGVPADHPDHYQNMAVTLCKENADYFDVDQYDNPNNPEAYYRTLGPEVGGPATLCPVADTGLPSDAAVGVSSSALCCVCTSAFMSNVTYVVALLCFALEGPSCFRCYVKCTGRKIRVCSSMISAPSVCCFPMVLLSGDCALAWLFLVV